MRKHYKTTGKNHSSSLLFGPLRGFRLGLPPLCRAERPAAAPETLSLGGGAAQAKRAVRLRFFFFFFSVFFGCFFSGFSVVFYWFYGFSNVLGSFLVFFFSLLTWKGKMFVPYRDARFFCRVRLLFFFLKGGAGSGDNLFFGFPRDNFPWCVIIPAIFRKCLISCPSCGWTYRNYERIACGGTSSYVSRIGIYSYQNSP